MQRDCNTPITSGGTPAPLRTLLADDSAVFVTHLRGFLDLQAHIQVVDTAANGIEALRKAEALEPDLVLMDLHMPGMDGLQAAALLRRRLPGTRIILMTVDATVDAQTAAHTHGAHGFVAKTKIPAALMTEIQRVFLLTDASDEKKGTT